MRKKLGEKFGVVFSFAVVVTDTELCCGVVGRPLDVVIVVFPYFTPKALGLHAV